MKLRSFHAGLLTAAYCGLMTVSAAAQQTHSSNDRHYIYDQFVPPGVAGQMHLASGELRPSIPQQLRIHLPEPGVVTFYNGTLSQPVMGTAPAQFAVQSGRFYRFQISGLTNYPHMEFYPSVELVGELHPPPGEAERFPIEVEILEEELRWVARGQMVTKVVYLEQADRVPLRNLTGVARVIDVEQGQNAIAEADALGRPIAIVRIGGRTPDLNHFDAGFWGPLPPVRLVTPIATEPASHNAVSTAPAPSQQPLTGRSRTKIFPASAQSPAIR